MELVRDRNGKDLDAVFVCCGGGGMLAGKSAHESASAHKRTST